MLPEPVMTHDLYDYFVQLQGKVISVTRACVRVYVPGVPLGKLLFA
jgi:hypothetical protein